METVATTRPKKGPTGRSSPVVPGSPWRTVWGKASEKDSDERPRRAADASPGFSSPDWAVPEVASVSGWVALL